MIVRASVDVVVGVLQRGDKILLAQRPAQKSYAGYWELAGGKIEPGETIVTALKRELYEELGIEVQAAQALFQYKHAYQQDTVHLHVWQVQKFAGEPQGKENQLLRWVTSQEMSELLILEGSKPILERLGYGRANASKIPESVSRQFSC